MADKIPDAWKHLPMIGGKGKGAAPEPAPGQPEVPNFFGVEFPKSFAENLSGVFRVVALTCVGPREFYTEAPITFEGSVTGIIQAFEEVNESADKKVVVKYKFLTFANTPVQAYAVDAPPWWENRKTAELAE